MLGMTETLKAISIVNLIISVMNVIFLVATFNLGAKIDKLFKGLTLENRILRKDIKEQAIKILTDAQNEIAWERELKKAEALTRTKG